MKGSTSKAAPRTKHITQPCDATIVPIRVNSIGLISPLDISPIGEINDHNPAVTNNIVPIIPAWVNSRYVPEVDLCSLASATKSIRIF